MPARTFASLLLIVIASAGVTVLAAFEFGAPPALLAVAATVAALIVRLRTRPK